MRRKTSVSGSVWFFLFCTLLSSRIFFIWSDNFLTYAQQQKKTKKTEVWGLLFGGVPVNYQNKAWQPLLLFLFHALTLLICRQTESHSHMHTRAHRSHSYTYTRSKWSKETCHTNLAHMHRSRRSGFVSWGSHPTETAEKITFCSLSAEDSSQKTDSRLWSGQERNRQDRYA